MMPKHISAVDSVPMRVVFVTLDNHLVSTMERVRATLRKELPSLKVSMHAATDWADDPAALEQCQQDVAEADIIVNTMLVMEEHIKPILPVLQERRDDCDAMVSCMSAGEVMKLTRMGRFRMDGTKGGPMAFLKRLRGNKDDSKKHKSAGAEQAAMLRRIPQILRFIPGTAQDVRAYFLTLQYWLAGSDENMANLVRFLVDRYAAGPRESLRGSLKVQPPIEYPEVGVYYPDLQQRVTDQLAHLPVRGDRPKVGLLLMRSYVLAGNSTHYDAVIRALEARGMDVVPAFASGLDARPAVERFFLANGGPIVDAVVSLTGFSLVGGPAYNDAKAAEALLSELDVPYLAAHAVEFQTLDQWQQSDRGLLPVEATMMVAIPELDGATGPILFGGRSESATGERARDMQAHSERVETLASRVEKLVALRYTARAERKVAMVLFNFPPNAGNTGTAAHLSVFNSLYNTLITLRDAGYTVEVPGSVDELRERIVNGNATRYGAHANVHARVPVDDHVRRERWLKDIEKQWGPAPARQQTDGSTLFVLGEQFGNVFVGIQPAFGYEGDPMRLLFEQGFSPTHAFATFYRYIREDFGAHAVLHFGTHGALEFMPGKQAALSEDCWPDRLIADLPNLYLYASNNPSEGTIAKRRAAATLISYLTPPIANAGLYKGLAELKASIDRWRTMPPDDARGEREELIELIQAQAAEVDMAATEPAWTLAEAQDEIEKLQRAVHELEETLIPYGLHVVGEPPTGAERVDMLLAVAEASYERKPPQAAVEALVAGQSVAEAMAVAGIDDPDETEQAMYQELAESSRLLGEDNETQAILRALDGRYVRPAPGGDLLRTPAILPTGRNLHGFDPFRLPSKFAVKDGARQAERLIRTYTDEGYPIPESIAIVLWGTDNLKTEGGPIGQALALMGAKPHLDSFGRLSGAELIPLEELGRPRIDVVMTLSGIFRDLLPLQTRMLAEAAYLAATADEPAEQNFIRKHVLAYQAEHNCDLDTAALRVFSNADGAYGSNVNYLVGNSGWDHEDELAETYTRRKCYAYGREGKPVRQAELLQNVLSGVELAYQNLDSVELGVTTIDHYFDTLGGISRAVGRSKGKDIPVYIGDQTRGEGTVRTLSEQVALETRTRMLNPKWYEGMLKHGYEGVRQIEEHVTNTMGWSATTGQVQPWVYERLTQTYILDEEMRERLAALNPTASAKVANRLLEAHEREYWSPDEATLEALRQAGEELEDRIEGVGAEAAA